MIRQQFGWKKVKESTIYPPLEDGDVVPEDIESEIVRRENNEHRRMYGRPTISLSGPGLTGQIAKVEGGDVRFIECSPRASSWSGQVVDAAGILHSSVTSALDAVIYDYQQKSAEDMFDHSVYCLMSQVLPWKTGSGEVYDDSSVIAFAQDDTDWRGQKRTWRGFHAAFCVCHQQGDVEPPDAFKAFCQPCT